MSAARRIRDSAEAEPSQKLDKRIAAAEREFKPLTLVPPRSERKKEPGFISTALFLLVFGLLIVTVLVVLRLLGAGSDVKPQRARY